MAFGKSSKGIEQLQKNSIKRNQIGKNDIIKLQKTLKDKSAKQIKDITTNYRKILANSEKVLSEFDKMYESTKKLQQNVKSQLIRAVDAKRIEMKDPKNIEKQFQGEIVDQLDEMKDFVSEIEPTIKAIHKKYKKESIPKMTALRKTIKELIRTRIENIKKTFTETNNTLKIMLNNPQAITQHYKTMYSMIDGITDYSTDISRAYSDSIVFIKSNIDKFIEKPKKSKSQDYEAPKFSNPNEPSEREINKACEQSKEAIKAINTDMKTLEEEAKQVSNQNSNQLPEFIKNHLEKYNDSLLKLTFIVGAEQALIVRITQYMVSVKKDLKEYQDTTAKLHTTATDRAKKIAIIFLRMIPAIVGMATGLGSTFGLISDVIESVGWFLNAIAYCGSDVYGIWSERFKAEIDKISDSANKTEDILFDSAGITTNKNTNL